MKIVAQISLAGVAAMLVAGAASAAPVTLTGNYLEVGISDAGTFGSDYNTSPGILHDPTGTQNFGVNDYLTPGTPHDGFTLAADQFYSENDNDDANYGAFGSGSPTVLTGVAALGYDNAASWSGTNGYVNLTNSYFFNNGDQRVLVKTTIFALTDLTNVAFARSLDPDPDVNTYGSYATDNQRGNLLFAIDDFVSGSGPQTGLTIALVNLDTNGFQHTTQINYSCCSNISPYDVLNHTNGDAGLSSYGDNGLNLAYNLGDIAEGTTITLTYAYAVGANVETTGNPTSAPEPATWAMMLLGFGSVGAAVRRRAGKAALA